MNSEQRTPEEKEQYRMQALRAMYADKPVDWNALIDGHDAQDDADALKIDSLAQKERKPALYWFCVLVPFAVAAYLIVKFINS